MNPPAQVKQAPAAIAVSGLVDLADGHAFVRTSGYRRGPDDIYVSAAQIRQYGLRKGDLIEGTARPQPNGTARGKFRPLLAVVTVNGRPPGLPRPHFDDLTPLYPDERLRLEDGDPSATARIIDLLAPIGKGQRGLIVAPPKAGKTMVLQAIATAIANSHPEVTLMLVLVGERPEEVTDLRRSVRGEVIFSTFDQAAEDHIRVAELAIERAKRLVETGADVVVLLDSITRLGRAYNLAAPASSRTLAGGVAASALQPPRQFLGAARNIEDGGSLTICVHRAGGHRLAAWTTCCSRSSRAPATWSCGSAANWPSGASSPPSTRCPPAPAATSCSWPRTNTRPSARCAARSAPSTPSRPCELLLDKTRDTASNPEFLRQIQRSR